MSKLSKWLPFKKRPAGETGVQRSWTDHPLERMRDEMNRVFDSFFRDPFSSFEMDWPRPFSTGSLAPNVDIEDKGKDLVVSVELPGMDSDDVEVQLADNALTIKGEKKSEQTEEHDGYYMSERSFGSFQRIVPLPVEVEPDKAEASFKKGVLTVRLPKSDRARETVRKIRIQSG
ncbi:MAG: Hsp20/alpha crystallin family protein [Deltaproteobacteria bacterium]|nr:Hsp20/alpha crystallin family protein [Deltaproteobacteria bacterium]